MFLSINLQATAHRSNLARNTAQAVSVIPSSSMGIAAVLLLAPTPPSEQPEEGCIAAKWLIIASKMYLTCELISDSAIATRLLKQPQEYQHCLVHPLSKLFHSFTLERAFSLERDKYA